MKIIIKATKLELTPAIYEYIKEKIGSLNRFVKRFEVIEKSSKGKQVSRVEGKLLAGRFKNEIKIEIEIARPTKHHKHGNVFCAEANMYLPGKVLRAEHSDWDIRIAINNIKNKLQQEIKKYNTKQVISRRSGVGLHGKK